MTTSEARMIIKAYENKSIHTEEDFFLFSEAQLFLIENNHDTHAMMHLGGEYYERKEYDLALKYYEMAAAAGYDYACECLGYIWYYGRTGVKDYGKAFECFEKGKELGSIVCAYKLADMYKNGYGVKKDYEKYKEIIVSLVPLMKNVQYYYDPLPEVYSRMGGILKAENKTAEALPYYLEARSFLEHRISYTSFFGNFTIMKGLIKDIADIPEYWATNPSDFNLFDLYAATDYEWTAWFDFMGKTYEVKGEEQEDGSIAVFFEGKWFRTVDDFIQKAEIKGQLLNELTYQITGWSVEA